MAAQVGNPEKTDTIDTTMVLINGKWYHFEEAEMGSIFVTDEDGKEYEFAEGQVDLWEDSNASYMPSRERRTK